MISNNKKTYCPECDTMTAYTVRSVKKDISVRGTIVSVTIKDAICSNCGSSIWVKEVEKENDIIIYDEYKRINGLLTSGQVKEIRRKRKMTQTEMARFLDIGLKDIARYENGSIQSKSIDNMIRLMGDDKTFENMKRVLKNEEDNKFSYKLAAH